MTLATTLGKVRISCFYGQQPQGGPWVCALRDAWGLESRQCMSPTLEQRLCFTAVATGSYEMAAQVAQQWAVAADDSTIHAHVMKAGERARKHGESRVERALDLKTRPDVIAEAKERLADMKFSLVVMLDGWMARQRGPDWGEDGAPPDALRVQWHEIKSAIVFRLADRAHSQSGRAMLVEKYCVAHQGEPDQLGRRLYAEALRRGLAQAQTVYVVADGGVWIWKIVEDRFSSSVGVLDFYHASQHLWAVARELHGEGDEARQWVEPLLHRLKNGGEADVLQILEQSCGKHSAETNEAIERERNYFTRHKDHLSYKALEEQGVPCGSGAMESHCAQLQTRFKRTGQFWTEEGIQNLLALEIARRNRDWDEIWAKSS